MLKSINKKGSEEFSRSVYSADLEDSLEKEQLYRRKITILMFEITIVAIMKLCLFNSIGSWRQTICKYTIFMKKKEATQTFKMLEPVETKT